MGIYLIRHAQSVGNVNGRTASHAEIELTEYGHEQAEQLTQTLPLAKRVITSSFLRTAQTAAPILKRDQCKVDVFEIEEFSYLSDQQCKNTTLEERKPWVDAYWKMADVELISSKGAESFSQFYYRVMHFKDYLESVKSEYIEHNLLIFSHGQFLKLFQMQMKQCREVSPALMTDFRAQLLISPLANAAYFEYK